LENLVVGTHPYTGQVLLAVVRAGSLDRALKDVVDLADGDGILQQIAAELHDAADGAVADQRQPQDRLF